MKSFFLLFLSTLFVGCAAQKQTTALGKLKQAKKIITNTCPNDYTCTFKILPNKTLALKKDEFGIIYGNVVKSDSLLVKYELNRKKVKGVADANFTETIYFNIAKTDTSLDLKDRELEKIKLILHRQCYCKGTVGYFKINTGNFKLNIKKNELTLNTNFSIKDIPHVLRKIDEKVIFEP